MWGSAIKKCLLAAGLCSGFHVVAALERSGPSISGFGVVVGLRDEGGQ